MILLQKPQHSFFLLLIFCLSLHEIHGQGRYSYEFNNVPLDSALRVVEQKNNINIYLLPDWTRGRYISGKFSGYSITSVLSSMLNPNGFSVVRFDESSYVMLKETTDGQVIEHYNEEGEVVKKFVIGESQSYSGSATISGRISDTQDSSALIGATVQVKKIGAGTTTDTNGSFELTLPAGEHEIEIKSLGYHPDVFTVILQSDGNIDRTLVSATSTLNEVVVTGLKEEASVTQGQMSRNVLEMESIEYVPTLMGEKDVIKVVELLPGVTSTGEGANGYSVRGGNAGQNLILVENAPLYNSSHLFGLFSIFNPGVVENSVIYKGTMPIQYGGRVSSVMDINVKDGTGEKLGGEAGIGLMSSRLHFEAPLSDKLSVVAGGRVSYVNHYLSNLENFDVRDSRASFYDTNAKITYELSDKNIFSVNGLISEDDFTLPTGDDINYGNKLLSANWKHTFSDEVIANFNISYSGYNSNIQAADSLTSELIKSKISTISAKGNISLFNLKNHTITAGVESNWHKINPGGITSSDPTDTSFMQIEKERALEAALFLGDEYQLNDKTSIGFGLRYSTFFQMGPGTEYSYQKGEARRFETLTDSTKYGKNEIINAFGGLEPRLFVNYELNNNTSIKFNVGRSRQYLHLISSSASVSPLSIWKTSNRYLKPQVADQAALGIFKEYRNKGLELSAEVFYRKINNLPDYRNGAQLLTNPHLERDLVSGKGKSYGLELQLSRNFGKLSGWFAYTYSRSLNKMASSIPEEQINGGVVYRSDNDRPHSLSVFGDYKWRRLLSISFNWIYTSGRPITYPETVYYNGSVPVAIFSDRNEYRIPDYHRLDLSLNWKGASLKVDKKWDIDWVFSMYNVYGRKNAYSIYFQREDNQIAGKKLSILAEPIPSVTAIIKF
ncbi:MAG: TonB-dependent receptor [Cyclobacteriaceae bacterium]